MMLLSDIAGLVAGLFLAIPPLKDQESRFREWWHAHKAQEKKTVVPALRLILVQALHHRRDSFNGYDTFLLAIGAIGLLASFGLKLFDL